MDNINNPNTDILDQIASYSQTDIENAFYNYKDEYEAQLKLNKVLKEENYEDNAKNINNFIARNSNEIDYQLERLKDITEKLKAIVEENNSLKGEYDNIIKSNDCIEVSNKLKEIKKIRQDINSFLQKAGI